MFGRCLYDGAFEALDQIHGGIIMPDWPSGDVSEPQGEFRYNLDSFIFE